MNIDILCTDGSPIGVVPEDVWGSPRRVGVGGSELALLTMCETWTKRGYTVRLYNQPQGESDSFEQFPISAFDPDAKRDILINFRTPNILTVNARGKRVWWSCDQFTIGNYKEFAPFVDEIVLISPFHKKYFLDTYGIKNTIVIDLPVRVKDFAGIGNHKIENRLIFTSVPDRGLSNLHQAWGLIKSEMPNVSLTITSDYRLWGVSTPRNEQFRMKWMGENVQFIGAVSRQKYLEELVQAEVLAYPCVYDELFCISCAEAQYAGAYPITSNVGALATTNHGTIINGNPSHNPSGFARTFANTVVEMLQDRDRLLRAQWAVKSFAFERYNPDNIADIWDERIFR